MKVLIINTYHYLRGGDSRHVFAVADLLKQEGHEVHHFGMKSKENLPCPDEEYFTGEIDYRIAFKGKNPLKALEVLWHSIYSFEARKNIARQLDEKKPDIAHLHSIRHHLTKSILPELKKRNIPVVWTLHDYKELCPNTSFYDGQNICEKCKDKKYSHVIWNKCKKGSLLASMITYLESKINDNRYYGKYIDLYIAPSSFLKNKFIEYGYDPNKFVFLPNFIEVDQFTPCYDYDNYLLYVGRIEKEKGLITLVNGFAKATRADESMQLKIAGTGSMEGELRDLINRLNLSNIEILGYKQDKELENLFQNAKAVVLPSECYENCPFSTMEAMAYGKPVIASNIGGLPEQVEDGVTGFLFEPGNDEELAVQLEKINKLSKEQIITMGLNGRKKVEQHHRPHTYIKSILHYYRTILENKS